MRMVFLGLSFLAASSALAAGRVSILDLGVAPGTNRLGCASAPAAFVRALGDAYDVRVVPHARMFEDGAFDVARTDLLVLPAGSLFPQSAARPLVDYLKKGGLLLTTGGYAFDEPMSFREGEWIVPEQERQPVPVCDCPVPLPPAAKWVAHEFPGTQTDISDAKTPEGRPALKISTRRMRRYNLGLVPFPANIAAASRGAIAFRAKGSAGTQVMRVELNERDGSRWYANVPVTEAWRAIALSWADFVFHGDSPTKGARGDAGDRIRFPEVVRLVVGISHVGNTSDVPHAVWISDLATGADPLAGQRKRPEARVRINHRHYGSGWMDRPRPDQLGVFSPAYAFSGVPTLTNDALTADLFPATSRAGDFAGWDASAMLTPQINGHAPNCATLRPVLACRDASGAIRGRAASVVHHFGSLFKGSSWALFGLTSDDLFATPAHDALLRAVVDSLFRRTFLAETRPVWACYRPGETARLATTVWNFSSAESRGMVRFVVRTEGGATATVEEVPYVAPAKGCARVEHAWPVPADDSDFWRMTAELVQEGRIVDREENAFAVWSQKTIAAGPKLVVDGTHFMIDGEKRFWVGAQMFLARQDAYTSASALRFYNDFAGMRQTGMRVSRNFFGWHSAGAGKRPEAKEPLLRLMDACVLLSQKFGIVNYFNPVCGNEIPTTSETIAREAADIEMFARRYGNVPGFLMDVRNEPRIQRRMRATGAADPLSNVALAEVFSSWSRTLADAAERGRPGISVATGWSQGWGGGGAVKDPPSAALPFTFTDCHYYGRNLDHIAEIRKIDQRVLGRPAVMGECGVAFNPERIRYSDSFATEEEAARRYRCQAIRTFGAGYAFMCNYGWTDLIEGNLTFAFCHWDGNPRDVLKVYSNLSRVLSSVELKETRPEVVLLLSERRFASERERTSTLSAYRYAVEALSWWGADYSVLPAEAADRMPKDVRLVLRTEDVAAAGFGGSFSYERNARDWIGARLKAAGAFIARRAEDPATLETYRVAGVGETAWAFWNGAKTPVRVERSGHVLEIGPERGGLLRVSDAGACRGAEEL